MSNELLRKVVIAIPVLGFISVMIYLFSTPSRSPVDQIQSQGNLTENPASSPARRPDGFAGTWPPSSADSGAHAGI